MKRIFLIFGLALFCFGLSAAVTAAFSPPVIRLNQLSTFTFDALSPHEQPLLTQLTITNLGEPQKLKIQVELSYNNEVLIRPSEAIFITKEIVEAGGFRILSNRHLISESESTELETVGSINMDIIRVMRNTPSLRDAILAGFFPDGEVKLKVSVKGEDSPSWEDTAVFTIQIRNNGTIYPLSPGVIIGQVPPIQKAIPISFLWNTINTGFNEQQLVVKEFPPNSPPSYSTVAQTGVEVYRSSEGVSELSGASPYIPFSDKYYYAWRVYTPLYDQTNPHELDKASSQGKFRASEWFVFRYIADDMDAPSPNDLQALLSILGNDDLINILNMGYVPTGEVILENRSYTGREAADILGSLMGKDIQVELKD